MVTTGSIVSGESGLIVSMFSVTFVEIYRGGSGLDFLGSGWAQVITFGSGILGL
jgi:hypothetical protein